MTANHPQSDDDLVTFRWGDLLDATADLFTDRGAADRDEVREILTISTSDTTAGFDASIGECHDEDGGLSRVIQIGDDEEEGIFFRVQSWVNHDDIDAFRSTFPEGTKVRITIERK